MLVVFVKFSVSVFRENLDLTRSVELVDLELTKRIK